MATEPITVKVKQLPHAAGLPAPEYQTAAAAGLDLTAAIAADIHYLSPGKREMIPTGLVMEIPAGFEGQVRPRSGLAARHGVTVLNTPGTIDADYRGEIKVILINHGDDDFQIARGDRIAQLVVAPVTPAAVEIVAETDDTERGAGGFGSTGA